MGLFSIYRAIREFGNAILASHPLNPRVATWLLPHGADGGCMDMEMEMGAVDVTWRHRRAIQCTPLSLLDT